VRERDRDREREREIGRAKGQPNLGQHLMS
jgi:hypothetical protein